MLSNVSIEEVGDNIKTIYLHNKQLACDVWMIVTMGLRFRDLLKLFFQTN